MAKKVFLTTVDNPYDPDTQFTSWYLYDRQKGYDSCDYLARIARTSNQLSDEEYVDEIERAIDEIVHYDFLDIYKKVVKET